MNNQDEIIWIILNGRIYDGDWFAVEEFEMLTLSYYQKLNEERADIVFSALSGGGGLI